MNKKIGTVTFTILVSSVLLAACQPNDRSAVGSSAKRVEVYRAVNGESFIPCYDDGGGVLRDCGENLYSGPFKEWAEFSGHVGRLSEESSWSDCSTGELACVMNPLYLLAVPKGNLVEGLVYRTHGTELTVEKCFESLFREGAPCETALIASRCIENCACLAEHPRRGVLFYFTPRFGITAFLVADTVEEMRSAQPARSWVLTTDEGFLKKKIDLPKSGDYLPCELPR